MNFLHLLRLLVVFRCAAAGLAEESAREESGLPEVPRAAGTENSAGNDVTDGLTTDHVVAAATSSPQSAAADERPKVQGGFLQELLRSSSIFGHIRQELELLGKQLAAIEAGFGRFEANLKEDLAAIQEDIQGLKTTSVELETDVQTSSDAMERIVDWTAGTDGRFRALERTIHGACKLRSRRHEHFLSADGCPKAAKLTKKMRKAKAEQRGKMTEEAEDDFLLRPQADAAPVAVPAPTQADAADAGSTADNECSRDIKAEIQKIQTRCIDVCKPRPSSCADVQRFGAKKSGSYTINPWMAGFDSFVTVDCDLKTDGGGWTIVQRRDDYGLPKENFSRNWTDYKTGFGDVQGEFWLGNEIIYALTNQEPMILRVELESFSNESKHAEYSHFRLGSEENKYRLNLGTYSGDAADSLGRSRNMYFSTQDSDHDNWTGNCARRFKGGWWFNNCHDANLNGFYYEGNHESYADGINWYHWKGFHYSLKRTELKIRPRWMNDMIKNPN